MTFDMIAEHGLNPRKRSDIESAIFAISLARRVYITYPGHNPRLADALLRAVTLIERNPAPDAERGEK